MTKHELRKEYVARRNALTIEEYHETNRKLCEGFFTQVDLAKVRVLHTYLPIENKREPDTQLIVTRLQREFPPIQICVPRINSTTNVLESVLLADGDVPRKNAWGIPEPSGGTLVDVNQIDLVIVPLLAFDQAGNRVGYGKGFYDKFLATCRKDAMKVGLSAFPAETAIRGIEEFDVRLDVCVLPDRIYRWS